MVYLYGTTTYLSAFTEQPVHPTKTGRGQNFERQNVQRLKYRNFKVANIKITKDELIDSFIMGFLFFYFRYLNTQNIK